MKVQDAAWFKWLPEIPAVQWQEHNNYDCVSLHCVQCHRLFAVGKFVSSDCILCDARKEAFAHQEKHCTASVNWSGSRI